MIRQYNVSKGVICRVSDSKTPTLKNAVKCHWYSWPAFRRRQLSSLLSRNDKLYLSKDDLLLIGARFRENEDCSYTLGDFERDHGPQLGVLGTRPSEWKLESRSLALSISKCAGIQVQGTQKKVCSSEMQRSS